MIRFVLQKIKNKKWLTTCLLLGLVFLVAAVSCQPMFKAGSLNKMLLDSFHNAGEEAEAYPTVIGRTGAYVTEKRQTAAAVLDGVKGYQQTWEKYLGSIKALNTQTILTLDEQSAQGAYGGKGKYLKVSYMPDMLAHTQVLVGEDYDAYAGNLYGCMLSESVMDACGFTVGETLEFPLWTDADGETLKLQICGIFKETDSTDTFWYTAPNTMEQEMFVSEETFDAIVKQFAPEKINYATNVLLDYTKINQKNVADVQYYIEQFHKEDESFTDSFLNLLKQYQKDKKTIDITLWVLELPLLGLVLAFIYMVTGQIIDTEQGEIAMMRSRGYRRSQIVALYALQACILCLVAMLIGTPLGYGLCKLAASTTDFLTFHAGNLSMYHFTPVMLVYGLAASAVGILFILIPVVIHSGVSIVQQKSDQKINKKMFWEKYFLDIVLLGVSIYLLHNFNQEIDKIRARALLGAKMDPLIFLDSVLFIVAMGLVVLRLLHYLVQLVYHIGRKKWRPAVYASFLQITRNFRKQGFISVFLILTVAMGLFNANAARTINQNYENRIRYADGADIRLQETWKMQAFYVSANDIDYNYVEPDPVKYDEPVKQGLCTSMAKVIRTNNISVSRGKTKIANCEFMGIHTKDFGETAYLQEELNRDVHWYTYLNELAQQENGVILSKNLAAALEVKVGDVVDCSRYGDSVMKKETVRGTISGKVVAVVDAWPGFVQYTYEDGEETEHYLIVANYAKTVQSFKISPYEIWYKLADGVDSDAVRAVIDASGTKLSAYTALDRDIDAMKETAMIRITNGMFTLSFVIALILCMIGFLIYWISSIRQRELLFGVYRAMGLSEKEINRMLVNEHLFSTLPSILAGGACGGVATYLFVRLFGVIYLPQKHNLSIYVYLDQMDVLKLVAVLMVMILLCIVILRRLVRSLNITQALKLGEE